MDDRCCYLSLFNRIEQGFNCEIKECFSVRTEKSFREETSKRLSTSFSDGAPLPFPRLMIENMRFHPCRSLLVSRRFSLFSRFPACSAQQWFAFPRVFSDALKHDFGEYHSRVVSGRLGGVRLRQIQKTAEERLRVLRRGDRFVGLLEYSRFGKRKIFPRLLLRTFGNAARCFFFCRQGRALASG